MVLLAVLCNIGFIVITLWYTLLSIPGFRWLDKFLYGIKAPPRPTPTWEEGSEDEEGFRHDFFFNGRVRLHYAHIGDVGKPLLLFLHGFPESWYSWRYQMKHFKNDYHCVAIDLRGYGDSDKPVDRKDYRMALLVSDVAEAVKQLSPDGKTVLAAHDWGGAVAWTFVYDHPELLHKFVIMNLPHPSLFLKNFQRNEVQMKRSWYIFYFQIPFLAEYRLLEPGKGYVDQEDVDRSSKRDDKFVSISPPSSAAGAGIALERVLIGSMESPQNLSLKEARTITDGARKPGSITAMVNYYRNIFSLDAVLEQGKNAKRPIIEVPTLLVWGEKDTALGKELTVGTDQYVRNLTTFYVPEASHWVQQDAHEAVNQKMEEFLQA